jgi:hypothetical protein
VSAKPGPDRVRLQWVISLIASADYDLGCAAHEAEAAGALTIGRTLDGLMRECIRLREGIGTQIGAGS